MANYQRLDRVRVYDILNDEEYDAIIDRIVYEAESDDEASIYSAQHFDGVEVNVEIIDDDIVELISGPTFISRQIAINTAQIVVDTHTPPIVENSVERTLDLIDDIPDSTIQPIRTIDTFNNNDRDFFSMPGIGIGTINPIPSVNLWSTEQLDRASSQRPHVALADFSFGRAQLVPPNPIPRNLPATYHIEDLINSSTIQGQTTPTSADYHPRIDSSRWVSFRLISRAQYAAGVRHIPESDHILVQPVVNRNGQIYFLDSRGRTWTNAITNVFIRNTINSEEDRRGDRVFIDVLATRWMLLSTLENDNISKKPKKKLKYKYGKMPEIKSEDNYRGKNFIA